MASACELNDGAIVKVGGACALLSVASALAGSMYGAAHGVGGQEIPVGTGADFASLVQKQPHFLVREWLYLACAVFAVGEGVGLYLLTRPARSVALWALAAFSTGILVGIVQDAASVAFVRQFPTEYEAADEPTRRALESLARTEIAVILVQQTVSNILLGVGVALYSVAVLCTRVASKWFGLAGIVAAAFSVFFGVVTASAPHLAGLRVVAEHGFGLVVLWDLWAGVVMLWRGTAPRHADVGSRQRLS